MPVTVSYPGLYLEEISSNAHSIIAAPTSVAVFVGYSHPFKTAAPGQPVRLFSFGDFERDFGGIFQSSAIDTNLGHAVYQFFLNGGSDAYAIGLVPRYQRPGPVADVIAAATQTLATAGGGIVFTAREPTDIAGTTAITIKVSNVRSAKIKAPLDLADYTITYGTRVESYRGVALTAAGFADMSAASSLVAVSAGAGGLGTNYTSDDVADILLAAPPPVNLIGTFAAQDFSAVFQADQPLDKVDVFNLLVLPGITDNGVLSAALAFAERKQAFLIMDPPANAGADETSPPSIAGTPASIKESGAVPLSQNGAIYFPYLKSTNPVNGQAIELPPSGFVAGVYARIDLKRGVWKAPAGLETTINNTIGVVDSGRMTEKQHGVLNNAGINCLRSFPGMGTVVFGARTLVSGNPAFQQNWYVPVRRMTLFIEQTLLANLKWVVFEPNDDPLWIAIRLTIENFLLALFNQGALQGSKPSDAFQVKCDRTTTSVDDQNTGRVNIVVAFAPLKPAEFVVIKIAHLAGQSQS